MVKIAYAIMLTVLCIAIPLRCPAEETAITASQLIEEAKAYIEEGNKDKAILALDAAFGPAERAGNYDALMQIGDLYIKIDSSLGSKAMEAWFAAGRCKNR